MNFKMLVVKALIKEPIHHSQRDCISYSLRLIKTDLWCTRLSTQIAAISGVLDTETDLRDESSIGRLYIITETHLL